MTKDILAREPTARSFLTVRELSDELGISEGVIRSEIKSGRLKSFLPRGRKRGVRVRVDWVDQWIKEGTR